MGLELIAFLFVLKLHLTMQIFRCVLRAADFLCTIKLLLLKDYTARFLYSMYHQEMSCLGLTITRLELFSSLLTPHTSACHVTAIFW